MIATYQHEIQSALQSRDDAQRHMRQLSDCVKEMLKESDNGDSMNSTLSLYLNQVAHQPYAYNLYYCSLFSFYIEFSLHNENVLGM